MTRLAISITILLMMLLSSCNSKTQGISEKDLNTLFDQEKQKEELAKYGNSEKDITVIDNQTEVSRLKSFILKKMRKTD